MAKYVRPGVYTVEMDISVVTFPKNYLRKIKIGKIFGIDFPNVIITSTPKGIQIW